MGQISSIAVYPVKGLAGVNLPMTDVVLGRGLAHDRRFAIVNGERPVQDDGGWLHCRSFHRLNKSPAFARFGARLDIDANTLTLTNPKGNQLDISLENDVSRAEADRVLGQWFMPGPNGPARLLEARRAYWDYEDATISFINNQTVEKISELGGQTLDPARFRANFYIDDLPPFDEFNWIGKIVRIDEALFEIMRPIPRCKAPSVNPATGKADAQILTVLARRFGHSHCGLYARVIKPGRVRTGSRIVVESSVQPSGIPDLKLEAASPRPMRIAKVIRETADVRSIWLEDPLGGKDFIPEVWAGMYLRLHVAQPASWRCYTLSGVDEAGRFRISVKRQGAFSSWVHDLKPGDEVIASAALGPPIAIDPHVPFVCLTAGIGITPVAALDASGAASTARPRILHLARDEKNAPLWGEVSSARDASIFYTRQKNGGGRQAFWAAVSALPMNAYVFICGPASFAREARDKLLALGIPLNAIRIDAFASPPTTEITTKVVLSEGPHRVFFKRSGIKAVWTKDSGSLLDLAEVHSIATPSQCRVGVCMTCRQSVISGTLQQIEDLAVLEPDQALLCCTIPKSDVVIDA